MQFARKVVIAVKPGSAAFLIGAFVLATMSLAFAQGEQVPIFSDDFSRGAGSWESLSGTWQVVDGRYEATSDGTRDAIAYSTAAPLLGPQTVAATVVVRKRLITEGWSLPGVLVFFDPSNFWMLGLTADANGRHYVDFVEKYQDRWQAQLEGDTQLTAGTETDTNFAWKYDTPYRLTVRMDKAGITGTVSDPGTGRVLASRRYDFGTAPAIRMGLAALFTRGCTASFDDVAVTAPQGVATGTPDLKIESGRNGNIAILNDKLPDLDPAAVDHVAAAFRAAGFGVTEISAAQACDPLVLQPHNFFLYVIPNAQVYPGNGGQALMRYLRGKGNLMVLGGPAFTRPVWKYQDRWIDMQIIRAAIAKLKTEHIALDFDTSSDVSNWTRSTNDSSIPGGLEVVPGGADGTAKCLKVWTKDLTGWNTFYSPVTPGLFPKGQSLLCFWAKGDEKTTQMSIEMNETDGSRWIGVVNLTTDWTYHVLAPEDFHYWPDSRTKGQRGGSGDRFHPEAAVKIDFGLASSHTAAVGPGPHTFWVDQVGTATNPFAGFTSGMAEALLPMETIYPTYKVYPLTDIAAVKPAPHQDIISAAARLPLSAAGISSFARPSGKGFGNDCKWRWTPLLDAYDKDGVRRGWAAWLLRNNTFPYSGSAFACFGIKDQSALQDDAVLSALVATARTIRRGVYLQEAGSRYFAYWPGEKVELGATVTDAGTQSAAATVRITVTKIGGAKVFSDAAQVSVAPGKPAETQFTWSPPANDEGVYTVVTQLLDDGKVIDTISHEMRVLSTRPPAPDDFVTVKGSNFYLHGKPWYPVGVNYWASYVSGLGPGDYGLGWFEPAYYDPAEVERDLDRMSALGINMVSIYLGRIESIRNLLDFIDRCRRHDIHVNGFLNGASPLGYDEDAVKQFLSEAKLVNNPTLFAYDIIWEPGNSVFNGANRPRWDADWEKWIDERYGSITNAEADWKFTARRSEGHVISPSDEEMRRDGPWNAIVAAYRRFMDDLMSRKWNDATRMLRAIDPHHLISFRQGNTLPQDFAFTATPKHIDFICPEGYAIPPGEDGYNAACFVTRYVHFTTGGKPIMWAEFGHSTWDGNMMQPTPALIEAQGAYESLFYRMALDAGANGTVPWWWPGGSRTNERSDFGIMNPDGTPRPSALLIKQYAPRMKTPREYPQPDTWLTIDRDAHAGGYWYLTFNDGRDAYAKAHAEGKNLGIRTAGTGTTSVDTPLVAVGNTPYNGHNPLKYLDAEFNYLQVQNDNGKWVDVTGGATIPVKPGSPVRARASVGNLQEAKWLTPASAAGKPGAVYLAATAGSALQFRQPIPQDVPHLGDADFGEFSLAAGVTAPTRVVLQMTADGRAWFGEKLEFTLRPNNS